MTMINTNEKRILKKIFIASLKKNFDIQHSPDNKYIETLKEDETEKNFISRLIEKGLINKNGELTDKGRGQLKIGVIGGVFDILHIGHIKILREASKYVDILVVIIATDDTVKKAKNRKPLHKQEWRKEVVESLKYVDLAVIGEEKDFSIPLKKIDPDVIFLGYDQKIPPGISSIDLSRRQVVKINFKIEGVKTSKILEKLELL